MTATTHILGGMLAGELLCMAGGVPMQSAPMLLIGAVAGALLPDIDHRGSKVSRSSAANRLMSFAVSALTTHRGVIHTPVFIMAFIAALGVALRFVDIPESRVLLAGLAVGMLSHLALDTLNPSGIMWLWPLTRKRLHLASIRTNSLSEWVTASALLALDVQLAASRFPQLLGELERLMR